MYMYVVKMLKPYFGKERFRYIFKFIFLEKYIVFLLVLNINDYAYLYNVLIIISTFQNQDGLIYIDVDFSKKPENQDKNEKPKIHGEEDRTEYTFVDFSKKAPAVKAKPKKEERK